MPQFSPFRGIRFRPDVTGTDLSRLTTPPYDVIDADGRARLAAADALNPVQLVLPEGGATRRAYQGAARTFRAWIEREILAADPSPRLYRYDMRYEDDAGRARVTTGAIGALELEPHGSGVLPHEQTMSRPKGDRLDLLRACRANLEPIWVLSLSPGSTSVLVTEADTLATCTDEDGAVHRLSAIDDPGRLDAIGAAIAAAPVMIADGHHRYETALAYRAEQRDAHAGRPGPYDSIMALVVELADDQLCVGPIHRLLSRVPGGLDLRGVLATGFEVIDAGPNDPDGVEHLHRRMSECDGLGLVDGAGLALLVPRPDLLDSAGAAVPAHVQHVGPVDAATAEVGVVDALRRAGARRLEVSYRHDRRRVAELVRKGEHDAAVLLEPVSVDTIRAVAEQGERMPPKTTFFYPKPRTGFVFRDLAAA